MCATGQIPNNVNQQQRHKADNKIGDEGTRALSETLKVNTTLQTLNLECVQQQQDNAKKLQNTTSNRRQTDNRIYDKSACELSEALKVNTTLVTLNLESVQQQQQDNVKQ